MKKILTTRTVFRIAGTGNLPSLMEDIPWENVHKSLELLFSDWLYTVHTIVSS